MPHPPPLHLAVCESWMQGHQGGAREEGEGSASSTACLVDALQTFDAPLCLPAISVASVIAKHNDKRHAFLVSRPRAHLNPNQTPPIMKAFAFAAAAVATIANLPSALGWWDNGHMMVGEVATQLMDPADVTTIRSVLSAWNKDFPNTDSITTAAIWADLVKCKTVSSFCTSNLTPSFASFDVWHYIDLPANVDGSKWKGQEPGLQLFADNIDGLSIDFMEKAMTAFATTHSNWVANLLLRQFIHVFGDTHQPLHTVGGVSPGLPGGDAGGNTYRFATPCGFSNLHALWDAAAGEYSLNNWAEKMDFTDALVANATELISWLPSISDPLNFDQYKSLSFADFSTAMVKNSGLRNVILDSYSYANNVVYTGLDLTFNSAQRVPCPSQSYVDWAAHVSKFRIAVGGKRLAVVLTQFAKQLRFLELAK